MDEENFKLLMNVFCRVLEGRPLCRCVILTSKRGRNSKGIVEKMLQSTMGDYHVPVRSTVFQTDRRSEHEHNAADAARIGARIGFGNEVLYSRTRTALTRCLSVVVVLLIRSERSRL